MVVVGSLSFSVGRIPSGPASVVSSSKAAESVTQARPAKPAASQPASPDISAGLLWSVNQPKASDHQATADYLAMRNDLVTGNLAAAQQSYLQMQNDLQVYQAAAGAAAGVLNQLA